MIRLIARLLSDTGERTAGEIASALDVPIQSVLNALPDMVARGHVQILRRQAMNRRGSPSRVFVQGPIPVSVGEVPVSSISRPDTNRDLSNAIAAMVHHGNICETC